MDGGCCIFLCLIAGTAAKATVEPCDPLLFPARCPPRNQPTNYSIPKNEEERVVELKNIPREKKICDPTQVYDPKLDICIDFISRKNPFFIVPGNGLYRRDTDIRDMIYIRPTLALPTDIHGSKLYQTFDQKSGHGVDLKVPKPTKTNKKYDGSNWSNYSRVALWCGAGIIVFGLSVRLFYYYEVCCKSEDVKDDVATIEQRRVEAIKDGPIHSTGPIYPAIPLPYHPISHPE